MNTLHLDNRDSRRAIVARCCAAYELTALLLFTPVQVGADAKQRVKDEEKQYEYEYDYEYTPHSDDETP